MDTQLKPYKVIGVMNSVSWMYKDVRIEQSNRGYFFKTRRTDGFGIGYRGDAYKNLTDVAVAIDEMLSRQDVTIDLNAILIHA